MFYNTFRNLNRRLNKRPGYLLHKQSQLNERQSYLENRVQSKQNHKHKLGDPGNKQMIESTGSSNGNNAKYDVY